MFAKTYWSIYLSAMVIANIAFALLPIGRSEQSTEPMTRDWALPAFSSRPDVDVKSIVSTGFWGQVGSSFGRAAGDVTQKEVDALEAVKLRQQIRGIIDRENTKEVLFGANKVYRRTTKGQQLPVTDWILVDVGDDWLKLSKDGKPESAELLKLFTKKGAAAP